MNAAHWTQAIRLIRGDTEAVRALARRVVAEGAMTGLEAARSIAVGDGTLEGSQAYRGAGDIMAGTARDCPLWVTAVAAVDHWINLAGIVGGPMPVPAPPGLSGAHALTDPGCDAWIDDDVTDGSSGISIGQLSDSTRDALLSHYGDTAVSIHWVHWHHACSSSPLGSLVVVAARQRDLWTPVITK